MSDPDESPGERRDEIESEQGSAAPGDGSGEGGERIPKRIDGWGCWRGRQVTLVGWGVKSGKGKKLLLLIDGSHLNGRGRGDGGRYREGVDGAEEIGRWKAVAGVDLVSPGRRVVVEAVQEELVESPRLPNART